MSSIGPFRGHDEHELEAELEFVLKNFSAHATAESVREIAQCTVVRAPWTLKSFPTIQGYETVVADAIVDGLSAYMLLDVFPYVRPNTLPIIINHVFGRLPKTAGQQA